ncbi:hypothetical protein ACM55G_14785 [Flavobacterium sp. LB3P122]|uniref:hypothetical protein n=1 Tax=Flavobacterium algoriphilum TaxID=3398738 RepID=UPI003A8B474A
MSKTIKITLPKSWNELSNSQLERIAFLFHTMKPSARFDLKILYILLDLKWFQFIEKAKIRIVLWNIPMSEIRKNYDFIYSKNDRTAFAKFLKLKTAVNRELVYACQDRLANLTADEFSVADDLHIKWRETKNIEYLHYLAAILYTKTTIRKEFDKNALHESALLFKKVPIAKLLAIEITYFGCKNHLVKRFPRVFPTPIPGTPKPKKNYGFGKIILAMTKGDLSKLETIKRVNIYAFLEQFEEDLTTASKQKA